ncbi:MAG: hypothetical protein NVSMB6_23920 [Burkholderiaceae bacterium]
MNNRADAASDVIGPMRGHYIALYACPMGELGNEYVGYYKLCRLKPERFMDASSVFDGNTTAMCASAKDALLAAEGAAVIELGRLAALPDEEPFLSIVYISSAVRSFKGHEALPHLPAISALNRLYEITSVLLHSRASFMQYVEGPVIAVERVYERIKADKRHRGMIELSRRPLTEREFPNWHFKYFCNTLRPETGTWGPEVFGRDDDLDCQNPTPTRALLLDCWQRAKH